LDQETSPAVARLVTRLDGMPLFPGPFTLEAAEAVAEDAAGPVVLRLVDCSLLVPPRAGRDGRARYVMLETLRAYGARLLDQAGESNGAAASMARYALRVAQGAATGLQTSTGEVAAAGRLDAEDPIMRQALAWAMDHDPDVALRLAVALAPWWLLRGRLVGGFPLLRAVVGRAAVGSETWCTAQSWLGLASHHSADLVEALGHYTAIRDAIADRPPSRALADCLAGRSRILANLGRTAEAVDDSRRSLAVAQELGYPAGQALALYNLAFAANFVGDLEGAVQVAWQAEQITADIPGHIARLCRNQLVLLLTAAGDLADADRICAAVLAQCRDAGDLQNQVRLLTQMAILDVREGRIQDAAAHVREAFQIALQTDSRSELLNCLDCCGYLCAATGRRAEALTVWAAYAAFAQREGFADDPWARVREQPVREVQRALGAARARAAEERGAAMSLDTAAEYALMLTAPGPQPETAAAPGGGRLSARERELVTLVAQGRTDAQIAAQLYISIRTVRSHLDRIRDKTGCRRRADLTRLALSAGLV
jgi:DNA-binding CsgD family transcriptional regulator/tetratricopeptide (TPR) repeat protein